MKRFKIKYAKHNGNNPGEKMAGSQESGMASLYFIAW